MKKAVSVLVLFALLAVVAPLSVQAKCGKYRHRHGNRSHTHRSCIGDGHKHGRSFWQKHRDKLTTAGGAGAGAAIGGAAGGMVVLADRGGGHAAAGDRRDQLPPDNLRVPKGRRQLHRRHG